MEPTFIDYPGYQGKVGRPSQIKLCPDCGSGAAFPMLSDEEVERLYQDEAFWKESDAVKIVPRNFPLFFDLAKVRWKNIKPHLTAPQAEDETPFSILDIGAGHGCFGLVASDYMKGRSWRYVAVEPDAIMRKSLEKSWEKNGGELLTVETLEHLEETFDMVVLSHVCEHVTEPFLFLKGIYEKLNPGGIIFIDVPHQDYLFKEDPFPHLLFYTPVGLEKLLKRLGFDVKNRSVWGRSLKKSPMNNNMSWYLYVSERIVCRLKKYLPESFYVRFYGWYFGSNVQTEDGVWLRAVGVKPNN